MRLIQTRRQNCVTGGGGGAEINFGRAREVYLCEFEGELGLKKFIRVWIKRKRRRPKNKKAFSTKISINSDCRRKILAIFHEFLSKDQKKVFVPKVL